MTEEYIDVLDEAGSLAGYTKTKDMIHKDGDWHITIHVWIYNDNGEVLLQRRCASKRRHPNMLTIFHGGHVSAGETSLDGVKRELKEELDLDFGVKDLKLISTIKRCSKHLDNYKNNEIVDLYLLKSNKKIEDMKCQKEEVSEIFFVTYQKLKKMVENKQSDLLIDTFERELEIYFKALDKELKEGV